jgi:hypothetical protein
VEKTTLFWLSPACVKPYLASAFCGRQAFLRILTAAKPCCERQFWHCQISRNVSNQAKTAKKAHQGVSFDFTRRQNYQSFSRFLVMHPAQSSCEMEVSKRGTLFRNSLSA